MNSLLINNSKNNIQEAATLVGVGLSLKEKKNFTGAKEYFDKGIEKIKRSIINEPSNNTSKELVFEYYSLFEKILLNLNNEEEFYHLNSGKDIYFDYFFNKTKDLEKNECINDLIENKVIDKNSFSKTIDKELFFPFKILNKIGESIEKGVFLTKTLYIRKEIWYQTNAKITGLHLKYEAYKTIADKIDNLKILFENNNVINLHNINKFCDELVDIQNSFSKEFTFIKPAVSDSSKSDLGSSNFYKKFSDISSKIKSNILSLKMFEKPDYIDKLLKLIKSTSDLQKILENMNISKEEEIKQLRSKIIIVSSFFSQTILKLTMNDIKELTERFLKKKILCFEQNDKEKSK